MEVQEEDFYLFIVRKIAEREKQQHIVEVI